MLVAQECLILCNPTDCSPAGIFQVRILAWFAISFSRGTSQPRNQTRVSCIAGGFFTTEPPGKHKLYGSQSGIFSSVQSLSRVGLFVTPRIAACQASLSVTNSQSSLKLMFVESVMPSNHLILCCPLLLPSIFPSIRVFSNESVLRIRWPKYWSFSISPSNECSGLISFRMDWLDLLAVQGTLEESAPTPQFKASVLWHSAFFIV